MVLDRLVFPGRYDSALVPKVQAPKIREEWKTEASPNPPRGGGDLDGRFTGGVRRGRQR